MNAVNQKKFNINEKLRNEGRKLLGISDETKLLIFVGRLEEVKRIDKIIDSLRFVKEYHIDCKLVIIGDGSLKEKLINQSKMNKINDKIIFVGRKPHDELPIYYNSADLLILVSEIEGFPMTILESLSCGTPVLASDVGGIPKVVIKNINGVVIYNTEPEIIAKSVNTIFSESKFDRNTIRNSVKKYSTQNYIDKFDSILRGLESKL
jgi:glycosyltransferase involved in cell wall biosynthesis